MVSAQLFWVLPYALMIAFAVSGAALAAGSANLLKRVVGVIIMGVGLALLFAASGVLSGAEPPILPPGQGAFGKTFSNPLQQHFARIILIFGAASAILALAIVVRIREAYGTIEAGAIEAADQAEEAERGP